MVTNPDVELAKSRDIPQVLELKCEATYGLSPALAVMERHEKLAIQRRRLWFLGTLVPVMLGLAAPLYTAAYVYGSDGAPFILLGTMATGLAVFFGLAFYLQTGPVKTMCTPKQMEAAEQFFRDLERLQHWSSTQLWLLRQSESELRGVAQKILVRQARDVLRHRRLADESEGSEEIRQKALEADNYKKFQAALMVLNRLGIADMDQKPYFAGAKMHIDAEWVQRQRAGLVQPQPEPTAPLTGVTGTAESEPSDEGLSALAPTADELPVS